MKDFINKVWRGLTTYMPPIHPEGYKFIAIFAVVTLLLAILSVHLFWLGVGLNIWCVAFFRDPHRITPRTSEKNVIAPADGVVCVVDEASPPPDIGLGDAPMQRVGVFMNVFNCHVNRMPVTGMIEKTCYHKGAFLNASLDKASTENERMSLVIKTLGGDTVVSTQIAGLVARRIVWWVNEEDDLKAGERYGLIRFGSRVDVYMPKGSKPKVIEGQKMVAGETIIAELSNSGENG